jgi:hypothetical protein
MKKMSLLILCISISLFSLADEGMWLPQLLAALNEKEMKAMGMKISAKDIYDVKAGSLKDAICQFGGGCTGEIISMQGLLLTNHHCGYDAITNHSTPENNILDNGFWAKSFEEEIPNQGLTATFIVDIKEVTNDVLQGVTKYLSEADRAKMIAEKIKELSADQKLDQGQKVLIRAFFEGNKYYMFITETYEDVRLVGTPPASIGQFGKDTDNWVWPRHNADFSVFRIYVDANNKPAKYSVTNVPMKPKRALNININGVKENDFTMVFGFPGRTQEYLPSTAVGQVANTLNPLKVNIRGKALSIMDKYMRADVATKLQYADRYAGIANAWKKWEGEYRGLRASKAEQKKKNYETQYTAAINANDNLKAEYGNVLLELNETHDAIAPYARIRDYYNETNSNSLLFNFVTQLGSLANTFKNKGLEAYNKELLAVKKLYANYKDGYKDEVEQEVCEALLANYLANVQPEYTGNEAQVYWDIADKKAGNLYNLTVAKSAFNTLEKIMAAVNLSPEELVKLVEGDKFANICKSLYETYLKTVSIKLAELQPKLVGLQRNYMAAQMAAFPTKRFYADANSTLRVAYGNAKGFTAKDGMSYNYYTYLDGVIEKYIPGDYEFDVPQKLIDLYNKKDFGPYGQNGKMPVCFIAANHTTGGNSGSPALDANGNFIGINFDRVWEGTMSDLNYDVSRCRNIMVDARYILFIIDKFGDAKRLINEMKIVKAGSASAVVKPMVKGIVKAKRA